MNKLAQRDKVTRLRNLIREAIPVEELRHAPEEDAWRQYHYFAANAGAPQLESSDRDKAVRAINRIATWYGWGSEVQRHLDKYGACALSGLNEASLHELHERMVQLEECVQSGCGAPDAPPAS